MDRGKEGIKPNEKCQVRTQQECPDPKLTKVMIGIRFPQVDIGPFSLFRETGWWEICSENLRLDEI